MEIRPAVPDDADEMSNVLGDIFRAGQRSGPSDRMFVLERYINHPHRIRCSVALNGQGEVIGFQSLKKAWMGNPYGVQEGWGIIGTHISPRAARHGAGAALFKASLQAAKIAGLKSIDATIGEDNRPALAYYEAMGFTAYRKVDGCICKVFHMRCAQSLNQKQIA
ncbi:MAG: GNAT family N-acetyltransferase [Rhizomicrobium sp.]